jgi:uncharacterized protein YkwD
MKKEQKKGTYPIIANAIRTYGAERVRAIVYGTNSALITNEAVAMSNWVNSRMHGDELLATIKSMR